MQVKMLLDKDLCGFTTGGRATVVQSHDRRRNCYLVARVAAAASIGVEIS